MAVLSDRAVRVMLAGTTAVAGMEATSALLLTGAGRLTVTGAATLDLPSL